MIFGIVMSVLGLAGLVLFMYAGIPYLAIFLGALPLALGLWRFKQLHDLKANPPVPPDDRITS